MICSSGVQSHDPVVARLLSHQHGRQDCLFQPGGQEVGRFMFTVLGLSEGESYILYGCVVWLAGLLVLCMVSIGKCL